MRIIEIMTYNIRKLRFGLKYLFSKNYPLLPLRLAKNYLVYLFTGKPLAKNIDVVVDFNCNIKCDHCFAIPLENPERQKLDYNDYRKIIADAKKMGVVSFTFTGGEPLLQSDLEDLVGIFRVPWAIVGIQSNGTLMTEERARSLKEAGLGAYFVSIDYADFDKHDEFRKMKGAARKAWDGMKYIADLGIPVELNVTVTKESIYSDDFLNLLKMCGERGYYLIICIATPVGRWAGQKGVLWGKREREYFQHLQKQYPLLRCEFDSGYKYGCPAMKEKIYITCYGDVLPCPFIHISFGNVKMESLAEIRKRCLKYSVFNTYHPHCLAAEDGDFITHYIAPTYNYEQLPVPYKKIMELADRNTDAAHVSPNLYETK